MRIVTQPFSSQSVSASSIAADLGLRRMGRDYRGGCPLCGGDSRFTLTEKDGKLLWRCWAGCDQSALTAELRARALYPEREQRRVSESERREYGRRRRAAADEGRRVALYVRALTARLEREKREALRRDDWPTLAAASRRLFCLQTAAAQVRDWRETWRTDPQEAAALESEGAADVHDAEMLTARIVRALAHSADREAVLA